MCSEAVETRVDAQVRLHHLYDWQIKVTLRASGTTSATVGDFERSAPLHDVDAASAINRRLRGDSLVNAEKDRPCAPQEGVTIVPLEEMLYRLPRHV